MIGLSLFLAAISSVAEINALPQASFDENRTIALTGTVSSVLQTGHFVLRDDTAGTYIRNILPLRPHLGDRIVLRGHTGIDAYRQEHVLADDIDIIGTEAVPPPTESTVLHVASGRCNYDNVTVRGFVADVFSDDIDPRWCYLVLEDDNVSVFVTVPHPPGDDASIQNVIRRHVRITGTVIPNHCGARRFIGPHLQTSGYADITVLTDGPFLRLHTNGDRLCHVDLVRQGANALTGTVRCTWSERHILIEDAHSAIHRIDLKHSMALPPVGSVIRASGLPETDLYRLNLSRADYAPLDDSCADVASAQAVQDITSYPFDRLSRIHWEFHGRPVRLVGRVLAEATPTSGRRAILKWQDRRIAVDVSSMPNLADLMPVGTTVEVSGCGLIDIDNWRPDVAPPTMKELIIVVRSPNDVRVIEYPPWWTPARLLTVIVALFVGMVIIAVWNRVLNNRVERRSRELHVQELGRAAAEFKTLERTRLAVELHDSLSQTLTGIASHIEAACYAQEVAPDKVGRHLSLAAQALSSCRNELGNCIWDLRTRTLEDPDIASAVRRTVLPHIGETELNVDFDIPRSMLTDSALHDILCVLRELSANAVRHGKARHITITGRQLDGTITVVTKDDGCGFDPENRPGSAEGHFGLLGVSERLDRHNAELTISSAPGRGATVTFTFKAEE